MPIANSRLNTVTDNAYSVLETGPLSDQYNVANPDAARMALQGEAITMRLGYQSPNPRLAAAVAAITQSRAAAGITVVDVTADGGRTADPAGRSDRRPAVQRRGAAGSGSTGSSAMDDYTLHAGNGNNLSGYNNPGSTGSSPPSR